MSGTSSFTAVRRNSSVRNTRSKEAKIGTISSAGHPTSSVLFPDASTILVESPLECDGGILNPTARIIGGTSESDFDFTNLESGRTFLYVPTVQPSTITVTGNLNSGGFGKVISLTSSTLDGNNLNISHPGRIARGIIYNAGVPSSVLGFGDIVFDSANVSAGDYIDFNVSNNSINFNAHAVNINTISMM
jgi:hypothetical protein